MRNIVLVMIITGLLSFISCSKTSNPVMTSNMENPDSEYNLPNILNEVSEDNEVTMDKGVFDAWKVRIDTETLQAEIVPARSAQAIGDIFDADLSQFLTVSPCANCLIIPGISWDGYQHLAIKVGMKHPFDDIATRPDLHGFDVRAIFILPHKHSQTFPDIKVMNTDALEEDANIDTYWSGLLSADGFTSHYDWLTTDTRYFITGNDVPGNLNPFMRFFDDFSTPPFDPHAPAGQNVMAVGAGYYQRTAIMDGEFLENSDFEFYIIADVAYGQSAVYSNRPDPQYYLPAFHRTEPWRVEYWIENNGLTWMNPLSTADLVVQVFDWQHNAVVDPAYPDPLNLSGIPESSQVLELELSIPGFQAAPIITDVNEGGDGSPDNPLQYRLQVTNENSASSNIWGLLAIRDQLHGSASPSGRMPVPVNPAGFPYDTKDILDYSLYMPVNVNMKNGMYMFINTDEIDGELFFNTEDQFASWGNTRIAPDFFMDPGHKKFQYQWDYDYDGIIFNLDGSGLPSENINFPAPGQYNVGLRVRTNTKPSQEYIYSLPVWAEGEAFRTPVITSGAQNDSTSRMRNHSAAITDDNFYLAFVHDEGGQRDIMLAIVDRAGNMTTTNVTSNVNSCDTPSLTVVEDGPNAGVYVAYYQVEGTDSFIYVDNGDLNGNGFNSGNAKRISTFLSADEFEPVIVNFRDALRVFYIDAVGMVFKIYGAHSDDYNQNWAQDGWLVNNSSTFQMQPCVAQGDYDLFLIWADVVNAAQSGWDIYMAESADGLIYNNIQNISSTLGVIEEYAPSAMHHRNQIAITYLSYNPPAPERDVKLTIYNRNNRMKSDFVIDPGEPNITHTFPAVGCASNNRFFLLYGEKDNSTNEMVLVGREYVFSEFDNTSYFSRYSDIDIGTVSLNNENNLPVIASRTPSHYVVENFLAWIDYTDGETGVAPYYYGDIKTAYFITERFWWDY